MFELVILRSSSLGGKEHTSIWLVGDLLKNQVCHNNVEPSYSLRDFCQAALKFCITIDYIIIYRMHMYFRRHLAAELEKYYVGGSLSSRVTAYQKMYYFKAYKTLQKLPVWVCDGYPGVHTLTFAGQCLLH